MAISNAIQKGPYVFIYDENGNQKMSIPASTNPGDGLTGYTSSTVNIKEGPYIFTYNENGVRISSTPTT